MDSDPHYCSWESTHSIPGYTPMERERGTLHAFHSLEPLHMRLCTHGLGVPSQSVPALSIPFGRVSETDVLRNEFGPRTEPLRRSRSSVEFPELPSNHVHDGDHSMEEMGNVFDPRIHEHDPHSERFFPYSQRCDSGSGRHMIQGGTGDAGSYFLSSASSCPPPLSSFPYNTRDEFVHPETSAYSSIPTGPVPCYGHDPFHTATASDIPSLQDVYVSDSMYSTSSTKGSFFLNDIASSSMYDPFLHSHTVYSSLPGGSTLMISGSLSNGLQAFFPAVASPMPLGMDSGNSGLYMYRTPHVLGIPAQNAWLSGGGSFVHAPRVLAYFHPSGAALQRIDLSSTPHLLSASQAQSFSVHGPPSFDMYSMQSQSPAAVNNGSWMNEVASTVYQNDRRENEPFPGMKNRPVIYYQDEGDTEGNKRVLTSNRSSAQEYFESAHREYTNANYEKAKEFSEYAYRLDPSRTDILLLLGAVHYQMKDFSSALRYNREAISINPRFPEAYGNLGNCQREFGDFDGAIASYTTAIALKPDFADAFANLASTLVDKGDSISAIQYYEIAVKLKAMPESLSNLGNLYKSCGRVDEAIVHYRNAIELNPSFAIAWSNLASALREKNDIKNAIAHYERAIALDPDFVDAQINLGICLRDSGEVDRAISCHQRALQSNPRSILALANLASIYYDKGDFAKSVEFYQAALSISPANPDMLNNLGNALREIGKGEEALGAYERALQINPNHHHALNNLGNIYKDRGMNDHAMKCYIRSLESFSGFPAAHSNLASVYKELGMVSECLQHYNLAISFDPNFADAYINQANVMKEQGYFDAAISSYMIAAKLRPSNADIYVNIANALKDSSRVEDSIPYYEKALSLQSDYPDAFANYVHSLCFICNWLHRESNLSKLEKIVRSQVDEEKLPCVQPFHAFTYPFDQKLFRRICELYAKRSETNAETMVRNARTRRGHPVFVSEYLDRLKSSSQVPSNRNRPSFTCQTDSLSGSKLMGMDIDLEEGRLISDSEVVFELSSTLLRQHEIFLSGSSSSRIRVGYVSSDFANHPLSHLMQSVFGMHDKTRFEVFCYALSVDDGSSFRRKVQTEVEHFFDISSFGIEESAALIHQHGIQVLFNLNGYTKGARNELFVLRPSPIQVMYMGFAGTSGASYMDYFITDRRTTPPSCAQYFSEKLLYMPHSYFVTDHKQCHAHLLDKPIPYRRSQYGLPEDGFLFCNFNQLYKLDPETLKCWCRILKRTQNTFVWLLKFPAAAEKFIKRKVCENGVDPNRFIFTDLASKDEHISRGVLADVFLDTPICNGHTTGCDILWSGTPMVTLPLESFASRVAVGLLTAAGAPELIANSYEEYENIAVKLASSSSLLRSTRAKLEHNRWTYPLFDTQRWVRNLETGIFCMWINHQLSCSPCNIEVEDVDGWELS